MEEVKAKIESEANKAQSQMQTSIDELKANISSIQGELENAQESSKSFKASCDAKDTELMELKGKLVDVTALNNGLSKDLEDTQKENLARLEQAETKIKELTATKRSLEEATAKIESEAHETQSQMQTTIDELKANLSSIQGELENAQVSSKTFETACDAKDIELMELKDKLVDVTELKNSLDKDLEDTQKDNLARLEQAEAKSNTDLLEVNAKLEAAALEIEELKTNVATSQEDKSKLSNQLIELNIQFATLKETSDKMADSLSRAEKAQSEIASERDSLASNTEHLRTAVSQLAKEKSALTASVTKAEDSVQALTEAKESLEGQLTTLTETKESLATERDALRNEAVLNKENIARLTKEKEDVSTASKSKLTLILAQQKMLEIQLEESKVQYQTTSEAKDAVEAEKVRLEASVKEFQAKLESLEKAVSESDDSPPPWETDEELKAMKPTDIRSCFQYCEDDEQSLSARHQTLLAEMCIDQLNSELSDAASRQIETNNEMERKSKEIESLKSKLKYANAKRIVAAQLLEPSSAEEADNVPRSPVKKTPSTSATAASRLTRSRSRPSLKPSALEDTADSFISCRDRQKRKAGTSSVLHGDGYDSENSVSSNDVINPTLSSKLTSTAKKQKVTAATPNGSALADTSNSALRNRSASNKLAKDLPANPFARTK